MQLTKLKPRATFTAPEIRRWGQAAVLGFLLLVVVFLGSEIGHLLGTGIVHLVSFLPQPFAAFVEVFLLLLPFILAARYLLK